MHNFDQSVLVVTPAAEDTAEAGRGVRAMAGVSAVTADPVRHQLIVRYDPARIDAGQIRTYLRAPAPAARYDDWIPWLPKVARALPTVAGMLL